MFVSMAVKTSEMCSVSEFLCDKDYVHIWQHFLNVRLDFCSDVFRLSVDHFRFLSFICDRICSNEISWNEQPMILMSLYTKKIEVSSLTPIIDSFSFIKPCLMLKLKTYADNSWRVVQV